MLVPNLSTSFSWLGDMEEKYVREAAISVHHQMAYAPGSPCLGKREIENDGITGSFFPVGIKTYLRHDLIYTTNATFHHCVHFASTASSGHY